MKSKRINSKQKSFFDIILYDEHIFKSIKKNKNSSGATEVQYYDCFNIKNQKSVYRFLQKKTNEHFLYAAILLDQGLKSNFVSFLFARGTHFEHVALLFLTKRTNPILLLEIHLFLSLSLFRIAMRQHFQIFIAQRSR